jgi:tetratricopeptide (TPR) repeat protein
MPIGSKTLTIISLTLACYAFSFGQSSYKGLKPGQSSRAEVERVLGSPVNQISETLIEYGPQRNAKRVYVQYSADSRVAERIEWELSSPASRADVIRDLRLPQQAKIAKRNAKGRLEEYFRAPALIVLTYAEAEVESGVARVAHFSPALYELAEQRSGDAVDTARIAGVESWPGQFRCEALTKEATEAALAKNYDRAGSLLQQARALGPACTQSAAALAAAYTEVLNSGLEALKANDHNRAYGVFQQAIKFDPNNPGGYAYIGWMLLYTYKDFASAETSMRAAVDRGGAAQFGITHDHDGFFRTYCQGLLYIGKSRVSFVANDGAHSFDVEDAAVKEASLNNFVGNNFGGFHLKVVGGDGKTRNYNFAPGSGKTAEADIALRLIRY